MGGLKEHPDLVLEYEVSFVSESVAQASQTGEDLGYVLPNLYPGAGSIRESSRILVISC